MMCYDGLGVMEISRILKMSETTVGKCIKHFNNGGLEELLSYVKASGAPGKLNEEEQQKRSLRKNLHQQRNSSRYFT
jgi:transposase